MQRIIPVTFRRQTHIVLILLGILPYLLVTYTFIRLNLNSLTIFMLVTLIVLVSHFIGYLILRTFSLRLLSLVDQLKQTPDQKGYKRIPEDDPIEEIRDISRQFNQMVAELEQSKSNFADVTVALMKHAKDATNDYEHRITESKSREEKLKPYIGIKVFEDMIHHHPAEENHLNSRRDVCVLFADIRGFTAITEQEEPEEVVSMLNEYFEEMIDVIHRYDGILDKFIGDELMAVFGLLPNSKNAAADAVNTAVDMQVAVYKLMQQRRKENKITFSVGIGINAGMVIAGDIGSKMRRDYTVIGDTVNVASRLVNLSEGNEILVSRSIHERCKDDFHLQLKGKTKVKNRVQEVEFFRVAGKKQ